MPIVPIIGRYCSPPCGMLSLIRSLMPTPMGFVRIISITCCAVPGRSTEIFAFSHRKKITAISRTKISIDT